MSSTTKTKKGNVTFEESYDSDQQSDSSDSSDNVSRLNIFDEATGSESKGGSSGLMHSGSLLGRRLSWSSVNTYDLSKPLYLIAKEDKRLAEKFRVMLRPPDFDRDDLLCSVHNFVGSLADYVPSIKQDKTFTVFKSVRAFLASDESVRLFGLLIHFAYWNVIHPTARETMRSLKEVEELKLFTNVDVLNYDPSKRLQLPAALITGDIANLNSDSKSKSFSHIDSMFRDHYHSLEKDFEMAPIATPIPHSSRDHGDDGMLSLSMDSLGSETSLSALEKEQLFIQLETCILSLFKKMGRTRFALVTGRQALISCCHFVVDEMLSMLYPWFAAVHLASSSHLTKLEKNVEDVDLKLRRLVHQSLSDVIDPSRVYTSTMLLNALLGYDSSAGIKAVSKKANAVIANEGKGKFYRTSAAIAAIMSNSNSFQTRKFLQRNSGPYVSLPGVTKRTDPRKEFVTQSLQPKSLLATILQSEAQKEVEKEKLRKTPQPLDFCHLFDNQPEANYFPQSMPAEYAERRPHLPALARHFSSPHNSVEVLKKSADHDLISSPGASMDGNNHMPLGMSVQAKSALLNLMVEKTAKLYMAGIQTDKTAARIALIRGTDDMKKR